MALRYEDLQPATLHETKRRLIDFWGCAIAGFDSDPARVARSVAAASQGTPPARVLGSCAASSIEMAAFANAVMGRCMDCNDTYVSKGHGHPSDMIPAVLAVADAYAASGREVLTAIVAAYEIFGAVADAASVSHKGWDHGFYLVLGSAAGAGRLLGLTKEQMADALAIAVTANIATRQTRFGKISMWKNAAAAAAVRGGVFAALLAKAGMSGPSAAFEGREGVWQQLTGAFELPSLGGTPPLAVERSNLKYFPAEYHSQALLSLALSLRDKVPVAEIESMRVQTYHNAYREIASEPEKWDPRTPETADHSLPYLLAVAWMDGCVNAASFSMERVLDPALRPLMNRITVRENAEFSAQFPQALISEIEVTSRSGMRHVERVSYPKGHMLNPMTDVEVEGKFNRLCEGVLGLERCRAFHAAAWRIDELADLGELFERTRIGGAALRR